MSELFDHAHSWATEHPKRSENPDGTGALMSWHGYCQSMVWRFATAYGKQPPSYSSAKLAADDSGPLNTDPTKAKPGAFHFWSMGADGHVAIDLLGAGSDLFMASTHLDWAWGEAIGIISFGKYQAAIGDPGKKTYRGWSMRMGTGFVVPETTTPTPVTPAKLVPAKPVKPAKPVPATKPTPTPSKPSKPVQEKPMAKPQPDTTAIPQDLGVIIPSPKGRKIAYAIYAGASIIVTNVAVAFAAVQIAVPGWLVAAIAVMGNLAAPFAAIAISNASPKK
jgi:hypothetical protein